MRFACFLEGRGGTCFCGDGDFVARDVSLVDFVELVFVMLYSGPLVAIVLVCLRLVLLFIDGLGRLVDCTCFVFVD